MKNVKVSKVGRWYQYLTPRRLTLDLPGRPDIRRWLFWVWER